MFSDDLVCKRLLIPHNGNGDTWYSPVVAKNSSPGTSIAGIFVDPSQGRKDVRQVRTRADSSRSSVALRRRCGSASLSLFDGFHC